MSAIQALSPNNLPEAPSTPGISRHLAFQGEGYMVVHAHVDPGVASGWHHHGEYDVFGYMASGTIRFEYGPEGKDVTMVGPGEFFHVPSMVIHRDVNPSQEEGQEVILFLRGSGDLVINVDGPG